MNYSPGDFAVVPNQHIIEGQSAYVQSVYGRLCRMADSQGICWPSHDKLAELSGCSVTTAQKALKTLTDLKILKKRNRTGADGAKKSNAYQIQIVAAYPINATHRSPSVPDTDIIITNTNNNHSTNTNVLGEVYSPEEKKTEKPRRDNTEITKVLNHFETEFDLKLKQPAIQRQQAFNLIRRYGLQTTLEGISAAALIRDERYAPMITDLKELWFKWDKVASFYARKQKEQLQGVAVITDD